MARPGSLQRWVDCGHRPRQTGTGQGGRADGRTDRPLELHASLARAGTVDRRPGRLRHPRERGWRGLLQRLLAAGRGIAARSGPSQGSVPQPVLQVEAGGQVVAQYEFKPPGGAEAVGLLAAVLVLLLTFGSLLAMGLPILTALFGIGIGISTVLLLANIISVPNFTTTVASMIGIGVGIDYALFIVTR